MPFGPIQGWVNAIVMIRRLSSIAYPTQVRSVLLSPANGVQKKTLTYPCEVVRADTSLLFSRFSEQLSSNG